MTTFADWYRNNPQFRQNRATYQGQISTYNATTGGGSNLNTIAPSGTVQTSQPSTSSWWDDTVKNVATGASNVINWDVGGWRPVRSLLNILSAPLLGVNNMNYQDEYRRQQEQAATPQAETQTVPKEWKPDTSHWQTDAEMVQNFPQWMADFWSGFSAGMTDDVNSPNYKFGADVLRLQNPNMTDEQAGWGGLIWDIAHDPLMLLPVGKIAPAVRGMAAGAKTGVEAVKAAEGASKILPATRVPWETAKGAVIGRGAEQGWRLGARGTTLKPVGLRQAAQVRDYQALEKLGKTYGIATEDLTKLAKGEITPKELLPKLTKESEAAIKVGAEAGTKQGAKLAKQAGKTKYTEELLNEVKTFAEPFIKNHELVATGQWALKSGKQVAAKSYGGYASYLNKPETSTVTEVAADGAPVMEASFDGSVAANAASHNTVPMTDTEILGILPGMTHEQGHAMALHTLQEVSIDPVNAGAYQSALAAYDRIFKMPTQPGLSQSRELVHVPGEPPAPPKVNPTVYDDPALDAIEASKRINNGGNAQLERLREMSAQEFPAESAVAVEERAQIMDDVIETIGGPGSLTEIKMSLGLTADESVSKFLFGSNEFITSLKEGSYEVVYGAIKALAELSVDIPAYSNKAREIVAMWEKAPTEADKWKIISDLGSEYRTALESTGASLTEDASSMATSYGNLGYLNDVVSGKTKPAPGNLLGEETKIENIVGRLEQGDQAAMKERLAAIAEQSVKTAEEISPEVTHPGASVNIFGKIIDNPEAEIKAATDSAIENASKRASGEPQNFTGMSAEEFQAIRQRPTNSNSLNNSGFDSLPHRVMETTDASLKKGAANHLKDPRVPAELNDIYDHVVGFARTPLSVEGWVSAIRRIANSSAAKSQLAADLVKYLHLDGTPDVARIIDTYQNKYLRSFGKMEKLTVSNMERGRTHAMVPDLTGGVDFMGRIFRDRPGGVPVPKGSAKLGGLLETQAEAELRAGLKDYPKGTAPEMQYPTLSGAKKLAAQAEARAAKARTSDLLLAEEARRVKATVKDKKTVDPSAGDPIAARSTDGSWLGGNLLNKNFLNGSVATSSLNRILHGKIIGDGLRNAFRKLLPLVQWRDLRYEVYPTRLAFESEEQLAEFGRVLDQSVSHIGEQIKEIARYSIKESGKPATVAELKKFLGKIQTYKETTRIKVYKTSAEMSDEYDGFGKFGGPGEIATGVAKEGELIGEPFSKQIPIHAMMPLSTILDNIIEQTGSSITRQTLFNVIAKGLHLDGSGITFSTKSVLDALRGLRVATGASRPATLIELKQGVTEGILTRVNSSKHISDYNKKVLGLNPDAGSTPLETLAAERQLKGFTHDLTYEERGMQQPDIEGLQRILANAEVRVTKDGKVTLIGKNGFREYPEELTKLINEAIMRSTGDTVEIAKASSGSSLASFMRQKATDLGEIMTAERVARIRAVEAVNNTTLWDGNAIAAIAKQIDSAGFLANNSKKLAEAYARIRVPAHRNAIDAASSSAYRIVIDTANKTGRIFRQNGSGAAWSEISRVIDESGLFKAGSIESWNAKVFSLRKLNLELAKSGVFDITSLTKWGGRARPTGGFDPDHAYIGLIHVMDAMDTALPNDAMRVIFDTVRIDGKTFPTSVIQESAVLAMKMADAGMDQIGRSVWLHDSILYALGKHPEGRAFAQAATKAADTPVARMVAMLADGLSDSRVVARLVKSHQLRAAMAVSTATEKSITITRPIMDALTRVADNVFASSGERSVALDRAIDGLRQELSKAGYANGSLEHLISSKMLESRALDAFSPHELNIARLNRRMLSHQALPQAERVIAVNAERAAIIRDIKPIADKVATESAGRDMLIATNAADEGMALDALDSALHVVDSAIETNLNLLEDTFRGGQRFRQITDVNEARGLNDDLQHLLQNQTEIADHIRANGTPEELNAIERRIVAIEAVSKNVFEYYQALKAGAQTPPLDETAIAEMMASMSDDALTNVQSVALGSMESKSIGYKLMKIFSGAHGNRELMPNAGAMRNAYDSASFIAEHKIEQLSKQAKKLDIPEANIKNIITSLIKARTPEMRAAFIQKLEPTEAAWAQEIWNACEDIFTGESLIRLGVDSSYYEKHLGLSILGKTNAFRIGENLTGDTFDHLYRQTLIRAIETSGGEASYDWIKALKGVNETIHRAMLAPSIAADFSARYGHLAWEGMTEADAIAEGWVKVKPAGSGDTHNFAAFIDTTQYYPKEMVTELANLQKLITAVTKPINNKFVLALDKINNSIKASITLWTLRNHEVNAQGEFMTNIMAGVYSPIPYVKAMRVMRDGGWLKNSFKPNMALDSKSFTGDLASKIDDASVIGEHLSVRIGGKTTKLSYGQISDLFNQHGIPISNNTVEDLIYEAGRATSKGGFWSKVTSPFWKTNRALGHFASRRDNLFRFAHAIDIMEKGSFRSAKEMMDVVQREIVSYHPTMHHLSAFEQRYARRMVFFYTWQRGMLSRAWRTVIEKPLHVSTMGKFNYNYSIAMGGDPVAPGQTVPNDPRLPSWANSFFSGPAWYNDKGDVVTLGINHPALDMMQKYLGGITYNPNMAPWDNAVTSINNVLQDNIRDALTPGVKVGNEIVKKVNDNGFGTYQAPDIGQMITDMTGLGSLSRLTGFGLINNNGIPGFNTGQYFLPLRTGIKDQQEFWQTQNRAWLNAISPFRYTTPSDYGNSAEKERVQYNQKIQDYMDPTNANMLDKLWGQIQGWQ